MEIEKKSIKSFLLKNFPTFISMRLNFINKKYGIKTLEMMKDVSVHLIGDCFTMDPIQAAEILSSIDDFYYTPYTYGFSNYSRDDYRKNFKVY